MFPILSVSLLYTGLSGIMLLVLSVIVIKFRVKHGVVLLDGGSQELSRAIRVQGNFTEYMPIFLLLLVLAELTNAAPSWMLHLLASMMLCGRIAHAFSLLVIEPASVARGTAMNITVRQGGMFCTFAPLALLSLMCLWRTFIG
ncbi:MAG: hypothetical protein EAZ74_02800 [Alphaproteobacteria bacterium]|nr:MAG: hypothetical protein EAY76_02150 [Alphaproteobacteria bacterium]TAF15003.1 MAG: hypothetical protein EAZ74_02800 [Alphaproteobacteria bacterium]TAF42012.1 MAG: hypothetical protein EAZ66_00305 [Alphaproteobacteria bacterium]TAF76620.1 MAG: hypothetical protein EAZ52_03600 [Alphaproteobacteria bacterium]